MRKIFDRVFPAYPGIYRGRFWGMFGIGALLFIAGFYAFAFAQAKMINAWFAIVGLLSIVVAVWLFMNTMTARALGALAEGKQGENQ